jgi:hypothetical protein
MGKLTSVLETCARSDVPVVRRWGPLTHGRRGRCVSVA